MRSFLKGHWAVGLKGCLLSPAFRGNGLVCGIGGMEHTTIRQSMQWKQGRVGGQIGIFSQQLLPRGDVSAQPTRRWDRLQDFSIMPCGPVWTLPFRSGGRSRIIRDGMDGTHRSPIDSTKSG